MRVDAPVNVAYETYIRVFDPIFPVTGLVSADFTKRLMKNGTNDATSVTVTEIDATNQPGAYKVTFTPATTGLWSIHILHSMYNVRGWVEEVNVVTVTAREFLEADETIDTTTTPWQQVLKRTGTGTELKRKYLRKSDTTNVTADSQIVGRRTDA